MKLTFSRVIDLRLIILFCMCAYLVLFSSCIKQARTIQVTNYRKASPPSIVGRPLININSASRKELESLPGIGQGLAMRIIEHRKRYGRFRRPEHLIMVRGLSDRRFRALSSFVSAE